jgi:hypothetical protein
LTFEAGFSKIPAAYKTEAAPFCLQDEANIAKAVSMHTVGIPRDTTLLNMERI